MEEFETTHTVYLILKNEGKNFQGLLQPVILFQPLCRKTVQFVNRTNSEYVREVC
jgi:hypothetical protein